MTNAQEKILLETNSSVNRLLGVLPGLEKITHDNSDDIETLQKDSVTKDECKAIRKTGVNQKRNNFLVVKDIILIILATVAILTPVLTVVLK